MKALGVVLVLLGLLALVYGGVSYTKREKVVDLGPIEATATERHHVPVPPIAGGLAVLAGTVMIFAGRKRREA
jgi:uncharacterized membrane protein YidH (DUF202 family)